MKRMQKTIAPDAMPGSMVRISQVVHTAVLKGAEL